MKLKKLAVPLLASAALWSSAAVAQTTLLFSSFIQPQHPINTRIFKPWAEDITKALAACRKSEGPSFLEIKVNKGARKNLGRPKTSPLKNKEDFMKFLET